ncbi:hypothetical protein ACGFY3_48045 [Streptomyces mirabilis]|uniref:hypothetical protein n=1 Tax=Streptomyces mirabilis TaxID=68239 RepID=UPI00371BA915
MHLIAAVTHGERAALNQRQVPDEKGEITAFVPLLAPLDPAGWTATFDALHTQHAHARFLVEAKNAHCIAIVKDNHPKLHAFLKHLPHAVLLTRLDDAPLIVSVTEQFPDDGRTGGHLGILRGHENGTDPTIAEQLALSAGAVGVPDIAMAGRRRHRCCCLPRM